MEAKIGGLTAKTHLNEGRYRIRFSEFLGLFLLALLLFFGIAGTFFFGAGFSDLPVQTGVFVAVGALGCAGFVLLGEKKGLGIGSFVIAIAVVLVFFVIFGRYVENAWLMLVNRMMDTLSLRYGRIFPEYAVALSDGQLEMAVMMLLMPLCLLLSMLSAHIARGGSRIVIPLLVLCVLGLVMAGFFDFGVWNILLAVGLLLAAYRRVARKSHSGDSGGMLLAVFVTLALLAVVFALPSGLISVPNVLSSDTLREKLEAVIESVRYGKNESALPEGDFRRLGPLVLGDSTMLEVTMSAPESYYLRGYVGEEYSGNGWQRLSTAERYEHADLFYWLHRCSFYGQTQLAELASAVEESNGGNGSVTMSVKNIGASAKYIYAPYEISAVGGQQLLDANAIGDGMLSAYGFRGSRDYTYEALPNKVSKYNELSQSLFDVQDDGIQAVEQYLGSEDAYRGFVYEAYTEVTNQAGSVLDTHFGCYDYGNREHMAYSDAKQRIFAYLSANITYSETPAVIDGNADFLHAFLERTRTGYSVHYATAAALMFRHFGIPARYVEGYLITPETIRDTEVGETVLLTGKQKHAWVEYYEDGVGWIPFEVTPPYAQVMASAHTITSGAQSDGMGDSAGAGSKGELAEENLETEHDNAHDIPEKPPVQIGGEMFTREALLLLLLLLLLALVAIHLIRRRRAIKALRDSFETGCHAEAICNMFPYAMRLLYLAGLTKRNSSLETLYPEIEQKFSTELCVAFNECLEIHREAQFSNREIFERSRRVIQVFIKMSREELKGKSGMLKRFKLKWLDFVY